MLCLASHAGKFQFVLVTENFPYNYEVAWDFTWVNVPVELPSSSHQVKLFLSDNFAIRFGVERVSSFITCSMWSLGGVMRLRAAVFSGPHFDQGFYGGGLRLAFVLFAF